MILQALVDYYELLAAAGEISRPGYGMANVSYALNLSPQGVLIGVMPLRYEEERGKKKVEVARSMTVPKQVKRAVNVAANFLCDNSGYVLGIDNKGKPDRTKQCFEAFVALHHAVLDGVDSVAAQAVLSFLDAWQPERATECPPVAEALDQLTAGLNIVFHIAGVGFAHEDPAVCRAWEDRRAQGTDAPVRQCLITGRPAPVARLHPSIRGVKGGQSMGTSIVSFNAPAFESYGYDGMQGMNAPVGEYAAFAYSTALNHLLAKPDYKQSYGDTTVVYWAKSVQPIYQQLLAYTLNPQPAPSDDDAQSSGDAAADSAAEGLLAAVFKRLVEGRPVGELEGALDMDTRFYILGLAPNAARLSVRFFLQDSFGNIIEHVTRHYRDLAIEHAPIDYEYLPLWKLMEETVSPMSRDKASSPLLSGAVLRAIFSGQAYPEALFTAVLLRIRAERAISRGKAAIIKAYLLRAAKDDYKEELTVGLSEESSSKPYVLGRLFAVLEKAQQDANPGINATIKDRYFNSACATPVLVFPTLLKLSNAHITKATYGYVSERKIRDLMDRLEMDGDPYPDRLTLKEQGVFILGYYHQLKANYTKAVKEEN